MLERIVEIVEGGPDGGGAGSWGGGRTVLMWEAGGMSLREWGGRRDVHMRMGRQGWQSCSARAG